MGQTRQNQIGKRSYYESWESEARACMDYLHGIVKGGEMEAACRYEYARESEVLQEAAHLRDSARHRKGADWSEINLGSKNVAHPEGIYTQVVHTIVEKHKCGGWFIQPEWRAIWQCSSFPALPWNQLPDDERGLILRFFPKNEIPPLFMHTVVEADALGILDFLKSKARKAEGFIKEKDSEPAETKPIKADWNWMHALFTLDFSKTKSRLLQEFEAWLDLPENKKRFVPFERDSTGTTGAAKDALKKLAEWRLYERLGLDEALRFAEEHRRCSPSGEKMPFHDSRRGQTEKRLLNQAPLWSEPASALRAVSKAKKFLARFIPWEFAERPKSKFVDDIVERSGLPRKISKSSS